MSLTLSRLYWCINQIILVTERGSRSLAESLDTTLRIITNFWRLVGEERLQLVALVGKECNLVLQTLNYWFELTTTAFIRRAVIFSWARWIHRKYFRVGIW